MEAALFGIWIQREDLRKESPFRLETGRTCFPFRYQAMESVKLKTRVVLNLQGRLHATNGSWGLGLVPAFLLFQSASLARLAKGRTTRPD